MMPSPLCCHRVYEPMEVATIDVGYSIARGCDFMAGGGYNLVRVNAAARFNGKRDKAEGNFSLVMWENEFIPIMMGREVLGVGKLLAEIPDLWHRGDSFGFFAAENGVRLVEGEYSNMKEVAVPPCAPHSRSATGLLFGVDELEVHSKREL